MAKKNSKKTVPELRFRGFTDPWEQRQLGESFNMLRNNTLSRADLSNDRKGILDVHYGDVLIRYRAVVDVSTLQGPSINITDNRFLGDQLTDGDIIMADTAEDTSAGKCVEIEGVMHRNVVAGLHTIPLRPATPSSHGYWGQYLNSASFRNQLFSKMQGTKVISLSRTTVSNATVRYPSLPEQRRIGEFFSAIDNLIAAAERQEALLRQKKQAYLQLMFPQEGETQPRLRFAGFSGEWERRQLGDAISAAGIKNKERQNFQSYSISNQSGFVPQSEQFDNGGKPLDADKSSYWIVAPHSFAYNPARINVGSIGYWDGKEPVIVSSLYEVFQTHESVDDSFLLNWFQTCLFTNQIAKRQEGGVRQYFFFDKLQESLISIPSLPEQRCIGAFFSTLDNLIAAAEKRTKSLHTLKSSYLQRMFV